MRLASRNDHDVTAAYPELPSPARRRCASAVLDGEVVAIGGAGRAEFGLLQRRMHVRHPPPALVAEVPVDLMLFDVLWLDGDLLTDRGQEQRRAEPRRAGHRPTRRG